MNDPIKGDDVPRAVAQALDYMLKQQSINKDQYKWEILYATSQRLGSTSKEDLSNDAPSVEQN